MVGQHNQFEPGWDVPNDGDYVEVGRHPDSGNLKDQRTIHLKKGDTFPQTSNQERKWAKARGKTHG